MSAPVPWTCSSPPGFAFSSLMADATSPERTIVSAHSGSVSVVDATYLGRECDASQMGLWPLGIAADGRRQLQHPQGEALASQPRLPAGRHYGRVTRIQSRPRSINEARSSGTPASRHRDRASGFE